MTGRDGAHEARAAGRALLEVEDARAGYGGVVIVDGVSLRIEPGEIVTMIGPNGAGKSTLLKAVFGSLPLMGGRIWFDGRDVTGHTAHQMVALGAAFVPQTDNVFPSLSIRENLEMGGYLRRGRAMDERIDELLAMFPELAHRPREQASKLSGGQRQGLAICRALMLDPKLLLLDEPTAALSPIMRTAIFDQIKAIRERGVAILMVEQNAREALAISDRGYVLVNGRTALEQSGPEMLENPDVGRLFLGRGEAVTSEAATSGAVTSEGAAERAGGGQA